MLSVSQGTVLAWETGTTPLFCVPYGQLRALANALAGAGARVGWEFDELLIASQCDLLVTGMLRGFEDYAEVPPIDEDSTRGNAARSLLGWAMNGLVAGPYRQYARPGPLLDRLDVTQLNLVARHLDGELAKYGAALVALSSPTAARRS